MNKDSQEQISEPGASESKYPRASYGWYVVVLMMCFYVLSFMDRQIIAVLIEPIKEDLSLSDVQISLLGGLSFVLFYSTTGIYVGRLSDSVNRPLLVACGVFIWSATTALCGVAGKFWHLLILRMGVGLGESALLPSTISLLADYFPPKRLAAPTSVFMLGAPIGIGLSFAGGGYLYSAATDITSSLGWAQYPFIGGTVAWKLVLLFLGGLGLLMTLLLVTVREPRGRNKTPSIAKKTAEAKRLKAASFAEVKKYTLTHWKAIGGLYFGMAFISLASYAQGFWDITFLTRTYGWNAVTGSFWYGMVQLTGGLIGMLSGGIIADRLSNKGVQGASVLMVVVGTGIALPFSFIYPLVASANASLCLMFFAILGNSMAFASTASALQRLFPSSMLGLAAGIYFFLSNAVGIGIGPTAIAAITDYLYQDPDMIRYSLTIVGGSARVVAFLLLLLCVKHYIKLMTKIASASLRMT